MAYAVAVTWVARPGEEERVADAARQLLTPTRAEPGCRFYQASRSSDDPRTFFFFEIYDDQEAFESHRASAHIKELAIDTAIPLLERRELTRYETLD